MNARLGTVLLGISFCLGACGTAVAQDAKTEKKKTPALDRTRQQIKMLDDIYKTAVVLITTHYVTEESDLPAGAAAKALFAAIEEKGWHKARLIDLTGQPYEDENVAKDKFEKEAAAALKSGKDWYEKVVKIDGKRYMRAATPVPVVLEKCIMCHDHYQDAKKGEAIGAIIYTVPIVK